MAVSPAVSGPSATGPGQAATAPGPLIFAKLKLRILRNGFRGRPSRVILFVLGLLGGLFYGGLACALLAGVVASDTQPLATLLPAFAGAIVVLGWILMPLVWFGVDDTLDPARFALLPVPRWALIRGILVGAMLGVPAMATALAMAGLVIGAGIAGGPVPALTATIGVALGVLLCVVLSRAVTSGFARALRARRTRDLAAVLLAVAVASIGPVQLLFRSGAEGFDVTRLEPAAEVLGWTPLGAPFVVGADALAGDWLAVLSRLAITVTTIGLLLWWWSGSLESAMLGSAGSSGSGRVSTQQGTATQRLFGRSRRGRDAYGALVVRELRYWFRDARRRANFITFAVVAVFLPVLLNFGNGDDDVLIGPIGQAATMVGIGSLAALGLANQFGFDGTSYSAHLIIGVPGRLELRSRVVAFSWLIAPILLLLVAGMSLFRGTPERIPMLLGVSAAAYGAGMACSILISVLAAYSLPENQNPFAVNTGSAVAKSLLALAAWLAAGLLATPVLLLVILGGSVGQALALPIGLGYGFLAIWLGLVIASDVLDRRQPELLRTVTPRG